jgi:ribosomal protein S24E
MQLEKISEKLNPILDRKEIVFSAVFDNSTVSKGVAKKEVAKSLGADESLIIIQKISQNFGENKGKIYVKSYLNKEMLEKLEVIHKKAKKQESKPAA